MPGSELTENAVRVLKARYLQRDAARRIVETPDELFARVGRAVAEGEGPYGGPEAVAAWRERFTARLQGLEFLPNSPTLMNAGTRLGQLSACFVLPVEDTMEGIFETLKEMALIQRTGGGTGFSFSRLRPRGDFLKSTGGEASGPVSFMKIYDAATEHIKQGGRRRGANMGILRVDHPDVERFIDAKREEEALRNFNISLAATDAFMEAVEEGGTYELRHPNRPGPAGERDAAAIFEAAVDAAWRTGDPGLFFVDTANRTHPLVHLGTIEATNPCGEIPLLPYEACNLGSVNLSRLVRGEGEGAAVDWERLREVVRDGVRFLDDVIEINRFPLPAIDRMVRGNRKIGLGVMGFAEFLIKLGVSYDSDEAVAAAEEVMGFIDEEAHAASRDLAAERGVFPHWEGSRHAERGVRIRNATCTAIAPTGTIGIIAGTSTGIEPLFALAYRRQHVLEDETLYTTNAVFREYLQRRGYDVEAVVGAVAAGRPEEAGLPPEVRRLFTTALEIPPRRHLQIQAAFQRHVDNSVSKTVNLPENAGREDVAAIYRQAWRLGCKGVTVYRYGSKGRQVLTLGSGESADERESRSNCDPGECDIG